MIINKTKDFLIVLGFLTFISLPIISLCTNLTPAQKLNEKRKLAQMPKLSTETIFLFPKQFDSYFNDNFGFRNILIRYYTKFKIDWLKSSQVSKTIIGKDGWLYFSGDDIINDYRCTKPFTFFQLKAIAAVLTERKKWLNDIGIKFLVVIAPNKHTIYPEYLPYTIKPIRNESRLDQLKVFLNENTDVEIVDLRKTLKEGKKIFPTYRNTDTHWTDFGALLATSNIVGRIKKYFPNISEVKINDYNIKHRESSGDLARVINMENIFVDDDVRVIPKRGFKARKGSYSFAVPKHFRKTIVKEVRNNKLPSVLIFRDSFCDALEPLLSEHFSRSTYVWCYDFLPDIVEIEKPDIVILEVAERLLNFTGVPNPLQVKNRIHKSTCKEPNKTKEYPPIVFEKFNSLEPQGWIFKKGVTVSNNFLTININSNTYSDACLLLNDIHPDTNYKLSVKVRKSDSGSHGGFLVDLFLAGVYDNSEQEILIPISNLTNHWKVISKVFNSGESPSSLLFRIGAKSLTPIEVDWVRLEENSE